MRKLNKLFFTIVIVLCSFLLISTDVSAKTLSDYRNDLASLKQQKINNEGAQQKTQAELESINREVANTKIQIEKQRKEIETTKEEIKELEKEIDQKEKEIKDLVVFLQLSNSENFYLKYVFGAESFTDLIYRISVIEQLTTKNDALVEEMNGLIVENNNKIKDLETKNKELDELNKTLVVKIESLGRDLSSFIEDALDIDAQIKAMTELIAYYESEGCGKTENVLDCSVSVPYDFGFDRPLRSGYVSSEFDMDRLHPTLGYRRPHYGIDLGGNWEGTPVLAPANGKVVAIYWRQSCGGTQVIMNHIVNGSYYTTHYMHLLTVNVNIGDVISKGQQIATVGGGSGTSWYDGCSTGAHLHFQMAYGHYLGQGPNSYSYYSSYISNMFNPRNIIWFPDGSADW